jgi:glutamine amidotransferase
VSQLRVGIVDYGLGNLFSVMRACEWAELSPFVSSSASELGNADALILPGVGAFSDAMENLRRLDLVSPLHDLAASGKPMLGVCLGLQLFLSESAEGGSHRGLDLIPGRVVRLVDRMPEVKVPHVGWSPIHPPAGRSWTGTALDGTAEGAFMYFVHSYHAVPENKAAVLCEATYFDQRFCSGLQRGNLTAFQFHPERSGEEGLQLYRNWAASIASAGVP